MRVAMKVRVKVTVGVKIVAYLRLRRKINVTV